jgi:hypothetical protein
MPSFTHQIDQRSVILPLLDVANLELGHLRPTEAAAEQNGKDRPIAPTLQRLFVRRPQQAPALIYSQPISQTHAEFLCSFDSLDTGGQFRAEQSTVSGLEGQAPHRRQAKVDRGCGKAPRLQLNPVPQDDVLAQSQSGLGTVPRYKIVHRECVSPGGIRRAEAVQHRALRMIQIW